MDGGSTNVPMPTTYRVALLFPKGHEYAARLIEGVVDFAGDHPEFEFVEILFEEGRMPPAVYQVEADGSLFWASRDSSWVLDLRDLEVSEVMVHRKSITMVDAGQPVDGGDDRAAMRDNRVVADAEPGTDEAAVLDIEFDGLGRREGLQRLPDRVDALWCDVGGDRQGIAADRRNRLAARPIGMG